MGSYLKIYWSPKTNEQDFDRKLELFFETDVDGFETVIEEWCWLSAVNIASFGSFCRRSHFALHKLPDDCNNKIRLSTVANFLLKSL